MLSLPSPPLSVSLPARPLSASLPPRPLITSSAAVPLSVLTAAVPLMIEAVSATSETAMMRLDVFDRPVWSVAEIRIQHGEVANGHARRIFGDRVCIHKDGVRRLGGVRNDQAEREGAEIAELVGHCDAERQQAEIRV